ncbi:MAG: hypothetical protein KatS3mg016_1300 [Fimbriimonadales bacterium]|nr:MAG: hypothetical protein KatS3mg016_1300 [Fimbriimonadales bacterium]
MLGDGDCVLGPIARIDLNNPANTGYYVLDGLGHVRVLVNTQGVPADLYHYDSWGNPLPTDTETTSRLANRAYEGISATASQLKRAWQITQSLKKVSWSKVPKPNVQDPELRTLGYTWK